MSFALDVSRLTQKYKDRADQITRKILIDMGSRLVYRSPVGDPSIWSSPPPPGYVGGRFRANWQYGVDQAPSGSTEAIDPAGGSTVAKITREASGAPARHYLVNNLPYAERIEQGHSTQAPAGVVALTVVEFRQVVDAAARGAAR